MCYTNPQGHIDCYDAPRKWYHLNTILIDKDSIFLYKVPVRIDKRDTLYSASDGAFYYYYGIIKQTETSTSAYLTAHNCDYCPIESRIDSLTGYNFPIPRLDTLQIKRDNNHLTIGGVSYKTWKPAKDFDFPAKNSFYFDSNSISRRDPNCQYNLISQAIKSFIQTKQLKLDNDTLIVCLDRYKLFEQKILFETLVADSFHIDTSNINFVFLTRNELDKKYQRESKVIRFIEIKQIVDYWKAARIDLTYKILIPKSTHKFREREYFNSFQYCKVGQKYKLEGRLPENSWGLVEQK